MMEAMPAAAFVMTEADLLLEIEIVAFDPRTQLGLIDHALQRDVDRQRGEPIVIRFDEGELVAVCGRNALISRQFDCARSRPPPSSGVAFLEASKARHVIRQRQKRARAEMCA